MNYYTLAGTTPDVLEKIAEAEKNGDFSAHLDPIDYSDSLPVDAAFPYIPDAKLKIRYWWRNFYFLNMFTWSLNRFVFHTNVRGKNRLHGIKGAVVTCNHINKFDGLVMRYALRGHRLKIMTADFNNRKGFLGDMMRASGILPFSPARETLSSFSNAVAYYLKHNTKVLFFPEGSEWWCYEKPRPFMDGAFHYAAANGVPVVPAFITFTKTGKFDRSSGIEKRRFTVHFLEPIYPDPALSKRENIRILKEKNVQACMKKYAEWYT
ncbi:lysophospholipid acyltransferase family protein [Treponema brennaborense]|uniref:Phospholipid/glycerol acyltransferase n=1 Tax=Treponema brennaborense (strain DSM 12168 / CIP 105900 / DD5/3) TaxID=906968 RepID=F4LP47_TREBD|nr:lysophospholipid acyltransferase family protein [Treponema brennaborense]AEE15923.1 phospholipid/glycerol acyltransferase [Treponema brennaborense DSM 12168]